MTRNKVSLSVIAALGIVGLSACGTGVESDASYETAESVMDAVHASASVDCEAGDTGYDPAVEYVLCEGADTVIVARYEAGNTDAALALQYLTEDGGYSNISGRNWMVLSDDDAMLRDIHEDMGGTIKDASDYS